MDEIWWKKDCALWLQNLHIWPAFWSYYFAEPLLAEVLDVLNLQVGCLCYSLMPFGYTISCTYSQLVEPFLATVCCSLSCTYSQLVEPFWLQFVAVFHVLILILSEPVWLQSFIVVTCLCSHMAHHDVVVVCHVSWSSPVWLHIFWSLHLEPQFWKTFMMWCHHSLLQCHFASQMISINEKSCQNTTLHNQCSSFKTTFKPMCHLQNQTSRLSLYKFLDKLTHLRPCLSIVITNGWTVGGNRDTWTWNGIACDPQSRKRDLPEEDEIEERRAKQVKVWLESPSVHVIGDCIMVFAENKSELNDTEMLSFQLKSLSWLQWVESV